MQSCDLRITKICSIVLIIPTGHIATIVFNGKKMHLTKWQTKMSASPLTWTEKHNNIDEIILIMLLFTKLVLMNKLLNVNKIT